MASEGTLDKFIGDSIMAFWNAPVDVAQHPVRAALCALAMRDTLREMNEQDTLGLSRPLAIGIGLNTGIACVGNMGAESRFNYSAVGDAVNTAARIEAASKELAFDILVSASTAESLKGFAMLDAGSHALKGKSERIRLYLLLGDTKLAQTAEFQKLQEVHAKLLKTLPGAPAAKAKILRTEAIEAANFIKPDLKKFYERLAAAK
jgi:adenylate cyclase